MFVKTKEKEVDSEHFKLKYYYTHKRLELIFNIKKSILHVFERVYIMIMLFNSDISSGVFSLFYLALAAYMWYNTSKSQIRVIISKMTMFIVML